jgi:hypothetical protein
MFAYGPDLDRQFIATIAETTPMPRQIAVGSLSLAYSIHGGCVRKLILT